MDFGDYFKNFKKALKDTNEILSKRNPKGTFKKKCIDYSNQYLEYRNKQSDENYNMRHPYTQGDIFDRMNNNITEGLYYADEKLGTKVIGHGIATAGRVTRNNYELYHQRSPFSDPFERSFDAFDKATNLGL